MEDAGFTADSVMLTFTTLNDSDCLANYTITTNAIAPSFTTNTNIIITKPGNDLAGATYFVSIFAVDFAGRMGPPLTLDCFRFSGENDMHLVLSHI